MHDGFMARQAPESHKILASFRIFRGQLHSGAYPASSTVAAAAPELPAATLATLNER
jgi:hypothetical protein